ncbi:MAG: hypothetical protein ACRC12_03450 [Holosporales bacterium]
MKIRHSILCLFFLLGGGLFEKARAEAELESSSQSEKTPSDALKDKNSHDKFKASPALTFPGFRVVILDEKGPVALLGLEVSLEVKTIEKTAVINESWIKIQSAIFQDLYSVAPFLWEKGYTPTVASLQKRIFYLCEKIIGSGILEKVKVQKAYMRGLSLTKTKSQAFTFSSKPRRASSS